MPTSAVTNAADAGSQAVLSGDVIDLTISEKLFRLDGRTAPALAFNGAVPGPVIRLKEGQQATLRVTNRLQERSSIHWHGLLVTAATAAATLILSVTSPAMAANSVLLSALLPGLGQAQDGHYGKAAIFGGAAIASWVGLFATQINYNRSVDKYEDEKRIYTRYEGQLEDGVVVKASDINATYQAMSNAYSAADDDEKWRNFFIGALVVTYGLNLVDILLSRPESGEMEAPATFDAD